MNTEQKIISVLDRHHPERRQVSQICYEVGCPPSTAHSVLSKLEGDGRIQAHKSKYSRFTSYSLLKEGGVLNESLPLSKIRFVGPIFTPVAK